MPNKLTAGGQIAEARALTVSVKSPAKKGMQTDLCISMFPKVKV